MVDQAHTKTGRKVKLEVRAAGDDTLYVYASNDTVVDEYGTTITVEGLMDGWLTGFWQHRTISQQHNLDIRELKGLPNIGVATAVDFDPQLKVTIRVTDPEVMARVKSGAITGASLEFVPIETKLITLRGVEAEEICRLSPEPEHCGLTLTDIPAVPGADLIEVRSLPGNWQYAVVDPLALTGESPGVGWFDHHDPVSHRVDPNKLQKCLEDLENGKIDMPKGASLTKEEVSRRALEHLRRHTAIGLGMRSSSAPKGEEKMNEWIKMRAAQLVLEGQTEEAAQELANTQWASLAPEVRSKITGEPTTAKKEAKEIDFNINIDLRTPEDKAKDEALEKTSRDGEITKLNEEVAKLRAVVEKTQDEPEEGLANVVYRSVNGSTPKISVTDYREVLAEVFVRTVVPQALGQSPDRNGVDNVLKAAGLDARTVTIEANSTLVYKELAREFSVKPTDDVVFRNHFRTQDMYGVKERTFPQLDGSTITSQWGRVSTAAITESDPTHGSFVLKVDELNTKTVVADSWELFNPQSVGYTKDVLIPEIMRQNALAEEAAFWLSTGIAPYSTQWNGLATVVGKTTVAPATNGTPFDDKTLGKLLRALPSKYRRNSDLAFYVAVSIGDDWGDILSARQTSGGDTWIQKYANQPGVMPIAEYRGIPIYPVQALPTNQVQGSASNATTVYLVNKRVPIIGDALKVRMEPYRRENFLTAIQLQSFVGLGWNLPEAIVAAPGILPKV
jgi:hypothetical protein